MSTVYDEPRLRQAEMFSEPASAPPPRPPRRAHPRRLLAAGVAAVLFVGVAVASVLPGTPGHQFLTSFADALAPGATVAAAQPQIDPQLAAIQQVIQRANDEQTQAISAQNPALMSDTATPAHYQQLVQVNQDLLAHGVTGIRLTNLAWGPISVNADTATATTYETWVTTFSDSTTTQSTDTNVYTLAQQSGSWIIEDDQQPNATPSAGQPSTAQGTPGQAGSGPSGPAPVLSSPGQNTSHNWSGYAATDGQTYTSVTGTWTVPQLPSTGAAGVGATWVGIGGVRTRDLIQAGTQDVATGNGQSQFQAWIEMLPQASRQVPLAVAPGDSVTVAIDEQGAGTGVWQIVFKNNTSGQTYQTTVRYKSSQSSAEWVEEAPSGPNGVVPLDNFGSVGFSAASTTVDGQAMDLGQANARPITMLNATGQALAVPSAIGSDGASFNVARTAASATPVPSAIRRGRGPTN